MRSSLRESGMGTMKSSCAASTPTRSARRDALPVREVRDQIQQELVARLLSSSNRVIPHRTSSPVWVSFRGDLAGQKPKEQVRRGHAVTPLTAIQSEYSIMERLLALALIC